MRGNLRNDTRTFKMPVYHHTMVFNGSWFQCRECGQVYIMAGRSHQQAAHLHDMHKREAKDRHDNPNRESNLADEQGEGSPAPYPRQGLR